MKAKTLLYWLTPFALLFLQFLLTQNASGQIRFEEMRASVQAPLWFSHHLLIASDTNNVGWYGLLVLVYKIFGFSLYTARYVLLVWYLIFLLTLAYFLRKKIDARIGSIILLTVGLSPTLMFITTLSLHWATVPFLLPICLILLDKLEFGKTKLALSIESSAFLIFMFGWITYPAFVFLIPAFGIWYLAKLLKHYSFKNFMFYVHGAVCAFFFVLPVIFMFLFIKNNSELVRDAQNNVGLLRGGGRVEFSEDVFTKEIPAYISDLFLRAVSYHFEVNKVEFSDFYPVATFIFVWYVIFKIYKRQKKPRFLIGLVVLTLILNFVSIGILTDPTVAGLRRGIPAWIAFYFLWVIAWYYISKNKVRFSWNKKISYAILSILTLHHIAVYPINLNHIADPSPLAVLPWLDTKSTPQKSLNVLTSSLQKHDLELNCLDILQKYSGCDYVLLYSALAASCTWNNLQCHEIYGYNMVKRTMLPLSVSLFNNQSMEW